MVEAGDAIEDAARRAAAQAGPAVRLAAASMQVLSLLQLAKCLPL